MHFSCSADHEQDSQPYPIDPLSAESMPGIVQSHPNGTFKVLKARIQPNAVGHNTSWHPETPAPLGKRGDRAVAPRNVWRLKKVDQGE